jgi:hypothetical protein
MSARSRRNGAISDPAMGDQVINPTWWQFNLARFDDDESGEAGAATETEVTDEADEEDGDQGKPGDETPSEDASEGEKEPKSDDDGSDGLGDKGKRALDRMKAEKLAAQRELKQMRKALAEAQKKVTEFEDRNRSDLEKAIARAEASEKRLAAATARSVKAEVKALAADRFADPSDAAAFLDLRKYADDDGEVDVDQIRADIDELLDAKPHLRKPEPVEQRPEPKKSAKPKPKPDPSQGSRGGDVKTDYRTADRETVDAKLSEYGYRSRARRM